MISGFIRDTRFLLALVFVPIGLLLRAVWRFGLVPLFRVAVWAVRRFMKHRANVRADKAAALAAMPGAPRRPDGGGDA